MISKKKKKNKFHGHVVCLIKFTHHIDSLIQMFYLFLSWSRCFLYQVCTRNFHFFFQANRKIKWFPDHFNIKKEKKTHARIRFLSQSLLLNDLMFNRYQNRYILVFYLLPSSSSFMFLRSILSSSFFSLFSIECVT